MMAAAVAWVIRDERSRARKAAKLPSFLAKASAGQAAGHQNMQQLIQLRWIAVVGQVTTIAVVAWGFGIKLPLVYMLEVLACLIAFNVASQLRWHEKWAVSNAELFIAMLVDVASLTAQLYLQRKTEQWEPWAVQEASMHDWRMVLEAGKAIGSFSSRPWLGEVDVPTSVVITMRDRVVPVRRQVRLFESIKGAEAFRVDGDHDAVVANADRFVPTLLRAAHSVIERADLRTPAPT
eukprot:gene29280-51244_t